MRFARRKPNPLRRSSTSWIRKTTRFSIYARDGFDCVRCNGVFPLAYDGAGLSLDHIVPRALGGPDAPSNLVTSCLDCNGRRQHARLRATEEARLLELATRPLLRELGRHYAALYLACRDRELVHPLTGRLVPKRLFVPYAEDQEDVSWEPDVAAE